MQKIHVDVIKWKHFPRYWSFVRGSHRPPVNSPHKGQWQWRGVLFDLRMNNSWINSRISGDLRPSRSIWRRWNALLECPPRAVTSSCVAPSKRRLFRSSWKIWFLHIWLRSWALAIAFIMSSTVAIDPCFLRELQIIFVWSIISRYRDAAGYESGNSRKASVHWFYVGNTLTAGVAVRQGSKTSAAILFT